MISWYMDSSCITGPATSDGPEEFLRLAHAVGECVDLSKGVVDVEGRAGAGLRAQSAVQRPGTVVADLAGQVGGARIEAVAYQHLPVFHTEHCVFCRFLSTGTSYRDCGRPCEEHRVALRDTAGRAHPVMADVGCRNTVFGAEAQEASQHLEM